MNIYEKLARIQAELKAPKGQYNDYGGFKYRSCEDITEAVKPLLKEVGLVLLLNDELELIGNRYYVKATATLADAEGKISVTAYAREDETKKGMDGSQLTGTASSYARKYALNGLFAIDDTKDADATHGQDAPRQQTTQPQGRNPARAPTAPPQGRNQERPQQAAPQQRTRAPSGQPDARAPLACYNCGVEITRQVYEYSNKHCGGPLCRDCQNKLHRDGRL
jgi:hypothetical protein